jgi:hypothetical protein
MRHFDKNQEVLWFDNVRRRQTLCRWRLKKQNDGRHLARPSQTAWIVKIHIPIDVY